MECVAPKPAPICLDSRKEYLSEPLFRLEAAAVEIECLATEESIKTCKSVTTRVINVDTTTTTCYKTNDVFGL
jgi:hypothetical protein